MLGRRLPRGRFLGHGIVCDCPITVIRRAGRRRITLQRLERLVKVARSTLNCATLRSSRRCRGWWLRYHARRYRRSLGGISQKEIYRRSLGGISQKEIKIFLEQSDHPPSPSSLRS